MRIDRVDDVFVQAPAAGADRRSLSGAVDNGGKSLDEVIPLDPELEPA